MSVDVVSDIEPRVQYTAAAAQTDFDYPFPIFTDADLVVDIDGVTQALTTDYTVTGAGDDTGGTVTLLVAATGNEVVTIYRDIAIERLTDFQQNGRFSSSSFNDELDKIIMVQQQLDAAVKRALRVAQNDTVTSADMELPSVLNRAQKYLYFNASGVPEAATAVTAGTTLSQSTVGTALYTAQTAAELAAGVTPIAPYFPPGDVRRYYDSLGDYASAISDALKSGEVVRLVANTNHPTSSQITCTSSCVIEGNGATISPDGAHAALVIQPAASGVSTTLAADAQINTYSITLTSATGFVVGDLITLESTAAWAHNPPGEAMIKGELHRIQKIAGAVITLDAPLSDNYNIPGETVTITRLAPIKVILKDFNVEYAANTLVAGIGIYQATGAIENVSVLNAATQGIYLVNSYDVDIKCRVRGSNRVSLGYGVSTSQCYNILVHDSVFAQCRRGIDFSGDFPSRKCAGRNCSYDGTGLDTAGSALTGDNSGFGSHESAEFITWSGCVVSNAKTGFSVRGANITIDNCEATHDIVQAFATMNRGSNVRITNNRYSAGLRPMKTLDVVAADDDEQKMPWFFYCANPDAWDAASGTTFIDISDNHVDDLKNGFINFAMTTDNDTVPTAITELGNLTVRNNRVTLSGSTATTTVHFLDSVNDAFTLKNSYIGGNIIKNLAATLTFAHADITLDSTTIIDQVTRGATSVADNATITHGHPKTPTSVIVTTSVADEWASVPAADISSTTFKVQLTKHDNTAGTTQTVYWQCAG